MNFDRSRRWEFKRSVEYMQEVRHDGLTLDKNGFWDLSEEQKGKKGKKRTVDDNDVKELDSMHKLKRACMNHHREISYSIHEAEKTASMTESENFERTNSTAEKWFVYRLTQSANNAYETCYEALVVAPNEEEARYIHPSNLKRGWWARDTYAQNAIKWNDSNPGKPMPGWYLSDVRDWVHPAYVTVRKITSFDGDTELRNTCFSNSCWGC
jgi:hypothetical protein